LNAEGRVTKKTQLATEDEFRKESLPDLENAHVGEIKMTADRGDMM
jgi:hypothetical protein